MRAVAAGPGRVVLVDDDEASRYAVSRVLRAEGLDVHEVASGREALDAAASGADLVLLDVRLPDLNGFDVCRALRQQDATRRIPIVHLSARRIESEEQLDWYLGEVTQKAGVKRVFIIAGDPPEPEGPYSTSLDIIETGLLEKHGITIVGIGGHPEGHPNNSKAELWDWMERKIAALRARGIVPLVVTQFAFDDDAIADWVKEMRQRGIDVPVRLGVPGPAGIKRLLGFAKRCGVGASASVMKKYGISLTSLIGTAGPDKLVNSLDKKLNQEEHGRVRLHFYPFGALPPSAEWINDYAAKHA